MAGEFIHSLCAFYTLPIARPHVYPCAFGISINTVGANQYSKDVTQTLQQRPESPQLMTLVKFMYYVFTRMAGKSYRRRLRSLLLCL